MSDSRQQVTIAHLVSESYDHYLIAAPGALSLVELTELVEVEFADSDDAGQVYVEQWAVVPATLTEARVFV